MKYAALKQTLYGKEASILFIKLYDKEGAEDAPRRYAALADGLYDMEGSSGGGEQRVFTAAGRTELCGNHTDHNLGKVVAASVHLDIAGVASPRAGKTAVFRSTGFPDAIVDLNDLDPHEEERGSTEALIRGIAAGFAARGVPARGFTVNADSNIPKGSGLSSSAACEVFLAKIYDCLNGQGKTPPLELAKIARNAENVFFGKPCGLMDQAASAFGGAVLLDFSKNPVEIKSLAFNPEENGYTLCVVNTGGSHAGLTADYAAIPAEMKSVAAFLGKKVLREITKAELLDKVLEIRKVCGDRAFLRALHFFNENRRVDSFENVLENITDGNADADNLMRRLFAIVNHSGHSSWELLQNVCAGNTDREQNLALALGLTGDFIADHDNCGACRVHGGGFAGTIQAYIANRHFNEYKTRMAEIFGTGSVTRLFIRPVGQAELFCGDERGS
jgi:galactokinase